MLIKLELEEQEWIDVFDALTTAMEVIDDEEFEETYEKLRSQF